MFKKIYLKGIKTNYSVSDCGIIRNDERDTFLKPRVNNGYLYVNISIKGKSYSRAIHRLVAIAFLEREDESKNIVNHKDKNRQNNKVENLEWVTQRENVLHSIRFSGHPTSKEVIQYGMDGKIIACFDSAVDAARKTDSLQPKITDCCNLKRKTHHNFQWRFANDNNQPIINLKERENIPKIVNQYDLKGNFIATYDSTGKAAKAVNGTQSAISRCCNNKAKTHKGYIWKFKS